MTRPKGFRRDDAARQDERTVVSHEHHFANPDPPLPANTQQAGLADKRFAPLFGDHLHPEPGADQ
jgi:hypothetical protein